MTSRHAAEHFEGFTQIVVVGIKRRQPLRMPDAIKMLLNVWHWRAETGWLGAAPIHCR